MEIVNEERIDEMLAHLESKPEDLLAYFEAFCDVQKPFTQYIATENFKLLKEEEYDLLVFLLVVIYKTIIDSEDEPFFIDESIINEIEEANWSIYNDLGTKKFNQVVDAFFKDYPQEDLLAFVEDSLAEDEEEGNLTQVGKEIIFITAKTLIDCCLRII